MKLVANDIIAEPLPLKQRLIRWLWAGVSIIGLALMRMAQVAVLGWIILRAVVLAFVSGARRIWRLGLAVVRFGRDVGTYWIAKLIRAK